MKPDQQICTKCKELVDTTCNDFTKRRCACGTWREWLGIGKPRLGGTSFSAFAAPVAYYKDNKGNNIPVDSKGNVTRDVYYDKGDYRGWKHAGHKDTSGYNKRIHLDENKNPVQIVNEK